MNTDIPHTSVGSWIKTFSVNCEHSRPALLRPTVLLTHDMTTAVLYIYTFSFFSI